MEDEVVLVNANDSAIGTAPKLLAHRSAMLHRAISVFMFNSADEWLLQRRAFGKYHSAGLWSNACCSHPRPEERPHAAAIRRLREEMGLFAPLEHAFSLLYKADVGDGMWEHELDHVFIGRTDETPRADSTEVAEWSWTPESMIQEQLAVYPGIFTAWFPLAYEQLRQQRAEGVTTLPW